MKKLSYILLALIASCLLLILIYNLRYPYASSSDKMKVLGNVPPAKNFYISEKNYASAMENTVLKTTDSLAHSGKMTLDGHSIAYNYYIPSGAKACVVVSHGYTERKEKYKELAYYFIKMGYAVFILDHYSHGGSTRQTADSSLVTVDRYETFTRDLSAFITHIAKPRCKGLKIILYGHSMGGGIAARTVEEYPQLVDALILNAPLMKLTTTPPDVFKNC